MMCIVVVGIVVTISQTSQDRDNIGHHQQAGVVGGLQGGSAPPPNTDWEGGIDKEVYNRKDEGLVIRD